MLFQVPATKWGVFLVSASTCEIDGMCVDLDWLIKAFLAVGVAKHLAILQACKYPEGHSFWAEIASFRALTSFSQPGASSARRSKARPHYAVVLPHL
jgi:hypothetical protein